MLNNNTNNKPISHFYHLQYVYKKAMLQIYNISNGYTHYISNTYFAYLLYTEKNKLASSIIFLDKISVLHINMSYIYCTEN